VAYDAGAGGLQMSFSEVAITIVSAILLGGLFWATMGSPPAEQKFSVASKRSLERVFKP
jgi:hypothetical protein